MKKRLLILALVIAGLLIRTYYIYYNTPIRLEFYEKMPQLDVTKHKKTKSILMYHYGAINIDNKTYSKNILQYAKHNKMDYFNTDTNFADKSLPQAVYSLFVKFNYEYVVIVPTNVYIKDKNKSINQLLKQAGDADMILCRNYNDHATINLDVIIFRNSEWTLYKLHQLYYNVQLNLDIVLDQLYVKYQHNTLLEFQEYLDAGIPYILTNICVYNEHALVSNRSSYMRYHDNLERDVKPISIYPWVPIRYTRFTTIPDSPVNDIQIPSKKCGKIPKLIFQTMETSLMITNVKQCIDQVKELNPDYKYYYFTSYDCRYFIAKHYPHILNAYDTLLPGAYKADLWRYCILHKYGGFYLDSRMLVYNSFESIITKKTEFMSCIDVNKNMIYQAILGAVPQSPFMKEAIDLCVDIIANRKNNVGDLGITGPKVMGVAVNMVLKRTIHKDLLNIHDDRVTLLRWNSLKSPKYLEISNTIFACHKYTKLLTDKEVDEETKHWIILSGKQHYSILYKEDNIYKVKLFK